MLALEQDGTDSILGLVAFEQMSEIVVADLTDKSGLHAEDGSSCNGIGCRASCHELYAHRSESLPNLISCLHIDMLHASLRKMELLQELVIRKDCKNVGKRVSDT